MDQSEKLCPMCGESIKLIAIKCKHCHSILYNSNEGNDVGDVYYYRYGSGKQEGPFTYEEIKDMYAKDEISSSVFISKNKSNDWDVITDYLVHNGNESMKNLNQQVSSNRNWIFLIICIAICSYLLNFIFFSAAEKDFKEIINGIAKSIQ